MTLSTRAFNALEDLICDVDHQLNWYEDSCLRSLELIASTESGRTYVTPAGFRLYQKTYPSVMSYGYGSLLAGCPGSFGATNFDAFMRVWLTSTGVIVLEVDINESFVSIITPD